MNEATLAPVWPYVVLFTVVGLIVVVGFFIRASDIIGTASAFGRSSQAGKDLPTKMELAAMSRQERFEALAVAPILSSPFNLDSFALGARASTSEILDRFEQLVLERSGPEVEVCRQRGSDPRFESALFMSEPQGCATKLFGWLRAVPTGTGVEWWLMASEVRRFKTPAFVDSHFAGLGDNRSRASSSASDDSLLFDVAVDMCALAFSGTRSHAGVRAAERLKVVLEVCLFEAATGAVRSAGENHVKEPYRSVQQDSRSIRRRRD